MQYCSNQLTKVELLEYFPVEDKFKNVVLIAIEVRKPEICQHLVNLHNQSQISLMKSFDWDLKLVIGNSSLSTHKDQIATLILNCEQKKQEEMMTIDITKEMVNKFINELEKVEV